MLPEEIDQLRVVDLKAELEKRGLSTKGLKAELAKRLREAVGSGDGSDAPAPEGEGEGEGEAKGTGEEAAPAPQPEAKPVVEQQGDNAPTNEDNSAAATAADARVATSAATATAVPTPSNPEPDTTQTAPSVAPIDTEPTADATADATADVSKDKPGDDVVKPTTTREGEAAAGNGGGEERDSRKRSRSPTRDRSPKRARGDNDHHSRDRRSHDRYSSRDRRGSRDRHGSRDRRGDRDRYRRSRSRSHGRRRRRSPSRSESPPRQRKRQWDIGPTGEITEPIRGAALPPPGVPFPSSVGGPTPGAVGVGAVHPSRLGAVGSTPMVPNIVAPMPNPDIAAQQAAAKADRPARRLYCGGVPNGVTSEQLVEFFNAALVAAQYAQPGAVTGAHMHPERNFAFIEFNDKEVCTKAMIFDGITLQNSPLKLRRPKDYVPAPGESTAPHIPNRISSSVPDGPYKIYMGGLSQQLGAEQIKELLQAFGPLQAFNLVTDSSTGMSRGFAFCEFVDKSLTEVAVKGLNGMEIMGRNITVQMANSSGGGGRSTSASGSGANLAPLGSGPGQSYALPPTQSHAVAPANPMPSASYGRDSAGPPSAVLRLDNMITPDDLKDDDEYNDILADIRDECSQHGAVRDVVIPRDGPGMLKVFVHFDTDRSAMRALTSLQGRKFGGQTVVASYYDPGRFSQGQLM